jgi:hypothetical protein
MHILHFPTDQWLPLEDLLKLGFQYEGNGDDVLIRQVKGDMGWQNDAWIRDAVKYPICRAFPNLKVYKHLFTYYYVFDTEVMYDIIGVVQDKNEMPGMRPGMQ